MLRRMAVVMSLGLMLLAVSWAGANPPSASPDEPDNLVKTVATGRGDLAGEAYTADVSSLPPLAARWFPLTGRSYLIPQSVIPPPAMRCIQDKPTASAACQPDPSATVGQGVARANTAQGTYEPLLYLIPGLSARGSSSFYDAQLRARVANALVAGLFLLWAALLLARSGGPMLLAGLAVGTTPMVLFLAASVTTNGTEVAAAECLWAALIAVTSRGRGTSAWVALGVSGATLALARMLDPLYILVMVATVLALRGTARVRAAVRERPGAAASAVVLIGLASLGTAIWDLRVMPHPPFDAAVARSALAQAVRQLPNQVRQAVGIFGWNDTMMPIVGYLLWLVLLATLMLIALRTGSWRDRAVAVALPAVVAFLDVVIAVGVQAQIGFGMQVRYLLPLAAGVPLVLAGVVDQRWHVRPATVTRTAAVLIAGAALLQLIAWTANGRRYAVGTSGSWLPTQWGEWSPKGGWALWFALTLVGAGAMALMAARMGVLAGRPGISGSSPGGQPWMQDSHQGPAEPARDRS